MPAYGSCAGMILLAVEITNAGVPGREALPLGAIDMTVRRNAFGRQVDSFEGDVEFKGLDSPVHAVFIRQATMLATAFHPEMTGDLRIHRLFVDML